jgi:hypothetical protein
LYPGMGGSRSSSFTQGEISMLLILCASLLSVQLIIILL